MSEPLYCRLPTDWIADPSLCWFEWQSLIGGILAIAAAGLGSRLLYMQIAQSERHESDRRQRRLAAVRATFPLALSGICAYSKEMLRQLAQVRLANTDDSQEIAIKTFRPPRAPDEFIKDMKELVEAVDDESIVKLICEIIAQIQILDSRAASLTDQREMRHLVGVDRNIDEYIVQSARLHVLTANLFPFARQESNDAPSEIAWDQIESLLFSWHIESHDYPGAYEVLDRRKRAWLWVWPKQRR